MSEKRKQGAVESKKATRETSAPVLHQAVLRRLTPRTRVSAEYRVAAAPALLEHYVQLFNKLWLGVGRVFSAEDLDQFRVALDRHLREAWAVSPYSRVVVRFATEPPPQTGLSWNVSTEPMTMADEYNHWVETRTPPLFGKHPDAKIFEVARSLGDPAQVPILDVGAGTGRNTLPLARAGYPTDAVELAPVLANILRTEASKEGLSVQVFERSILDPELGLPSGKYRILLLAEVIPHFRTTGELRTLFKVASELLPPGGLLVCNTFLASGGYEPDDIVREMSQVLWCKLYTRRELKDALQGCPLEQVSDESVPTFEHANLPADAWPPTGWFETWSGGQDLFDLPVGKPPMELRWLVFRKV